MTSWTRRGFVGLTLGAGSALLVACSEDGEPIEYDDPILAGTCVAGPTPSDGTCPATAEDIEGPYYLPDAPERSDLDTVGDEGVPLSLLGLVTDTSCSPLAEIIVEIWHADPRGVYDNGETQNYRGFVRTGTDGAYAFSTLVPGRYLNGDTLRPSHIHVKVHRGGTEALTTQIYFLDDPQLEADPWAEPGRTVCLERDGDGFVVVFDIALT